MISSGYPLPSAKVGTQPQTARGSLFEGKTRKVEPGNSLRNGCVKALRAAVVPADNSTLSATAQALDYLDTPSHLFPGSHLWTGTTGNVVKIRLPVWEPFYALGSGSLRNRIMTQPGPCRPSIQVIAGTDQDRHPKGDGVRVAMERNPGVLASYRGNYSS